MRQRAIVSGALVLVLTGGGLFLWLSRGDDGGSEAAARSYLAAWGRGDHGVMAALVADPLPTFATVHREMDEALKVERRRLRLLDLDDGVARFEARLLLRGLGEWRYQGRFPLRRVEGDWLVQWSQAVLHPEARPGEAFTRTRSWPERPAILGVGDVPLTTKGTVVSIGVEPRRISDVAVVAAALAEHVGVDRARVERALARPGLRPDEFVPLIDLREERYQRVRPALAPVAGIVFRRHDARLTPSEGFARHTLGRTGEITAERLEQLGAPYQAGDVVGLSGLEASHERELAGRPSGEVRVGERIVHRFPGSPGRPVRTTLDPDVQAAADRALEGTAAPAALVAVQATTGEIRAVASRPLEQPFNRALAGRYPPGSTFKVVTTAALLQAGFTPDARLTCPAELVVGGKPFHNFESQALGDVNLRTAFVQSCNTAFVGQASRLEGLDAAATTFGFGSQYQVGLPSFGGVFPEPRDLAERAAAAIGQGRVEASPLHMATVAAAVAAGAWRSPTLRSDGGTGPDRPPLAATVSSTLKELMGAVVGEGTGTSARGSGMGLAGKTGTAEYGTGAPPPTHAWFIGFRGDLAFAILIERGGVGGRVAAPLAARFLSDL